MTGVTKCLAKGRLKNTIALIIIIMGLPSGFTSLYRIFLRATSASVLHHGPATRSLRRLYRPSFETAANAIRKLENLQTEGNAVEAQRIEKWLKIFDERGKEPIQKDFLQKKNGKINSFNFFFPFPLFMCTVNNTLSFLLTSSLSRGLSHRVTSNLFLLSRSNHPWNLAMNKLNQRTWNPQLSPDSPEYSLQPPSVFSTTARKRAIKQESINEMDNKVWGALGEVLDMAQGRDGLVMGKLVFNAQSRTLSRKKKGWEH